MLSLIGVDFFGYADNGVSSLFQFSSQGRFEVCLLLKDESRQQRNDLFRLEISKYIFQNELREDQLISRMDL